MNVQKGKVVITLAILASVIAGTWRLGAKLSALERSHMKPDGAAMLAAQEKRERARFEASIAVVESATPRWNITASVFRPGTRCPRCVRSFEGDPFTGLSGELILENRGRVYFHGCAACLEEALKR